MSGLTGFDVSLNGVPTDLINIFQPYNSGSNPTTNYITNMNGYPQDLSNIFQPYISGSNPTTNYIATNGLDLSNIFQPLSLYPSIIYTITSNPNNIDVSNNISNNLYNISIGTNNTSGTVTLQFLQSITSTVMLVGGGGGGGGGGGETLFFSYTFISGSSYSFFLGSGLGSNELSTTLTTPENTVYTANCGKSGYYGGNGGGAYGNGGISGNTTNNDGTNGTYFNYNNVLYSIGGGGSNYLYAGGGCSGYDYVLGPKSLPFPLTENDISSNIGVGGGTSAQQGGNVGNTSGIVGGGGGGGGTNGGYGWCLIKGL